jgi:hypothetical protein
MEQKGTFHAACSGVGKARTLQPVATNAYQKLLVVTKGSITPRKRARIDFSEPKAKTAIMTPASYDRRFVAEFLAQLGARNWPSYDQAQWFSALRAADRLQPCTTPKPLRFRDRVFNDETGRLSGFKEHNYDGTRKWCALIDAATDRFWAARYGA